VFVRGYACVNAKTPLRATTVFRADRRVKTAPRGA